jgi:hypothetical protein
MRDRIPRIISAGLFAAPLLIGTGVSMPATDLRLVETVQESGRAT